MSLTTTAVDTITSSKKAKKRAREEHTTQTSSKKHKKSNADDATCHGSKAKAPDNVAEPATPTEEQTVTPRSDTQIALSDKHLTKHSAFVTETQSLFIGLAPVAHHFPLEGACAEYLSPLLLTYYPPFDGVVLSYSNPRLSQEPDADVGLESEHVMGKSIDEYGVTYIWLTAEILLFRPEAGTVIEGYVNLQNQSVLGLLCYNYFNAGIEQTRLPKDWTWVEEDLQDDEDTDQPRSSGHFVDGDGKTIEGRILFKVKDFEANASEGGGPGSIDIYGTLLKKSEDKAVDAELRQQALVV